MALKIKELKLFTTQLAVMLDSGLNLKRSFFILANQEGKQEKNEIYSLILQDLESGLSLTESLKKTELFPDFFLAVINAGEKSGSLAQVLLSMEKHYQNQLELNHEIKKSTFYPLTVLITIFIAAVVIVKFVLPVLTDLFNQFQGELPFLTRLFLDLAVLINHYLVVIIILAILLSFLLFFSYRYFQQQGLLSKLILKIPLLSDLYRSFILSKIGSYLAILLKSGLNLIAALNLLEGIIVDSQYKKFIKQTILEISKGSSLVNSFAKQEFIPDYFYYLLLTGQETARMESMLERAGDYYYTRLKDKTELLLQYLEPLLILLTAIFVSLLAAAVIMPMFQIYLLI